MTAITTPSTSLTSTATTTRAGVRASGVVRVGAAAGIVAAAATTVVAVVAKVADVPMRAAPHSATAGRAIPMSGFAQGTLMCTAIGVVLALAFAHWARRPARTFAAVTIVLTLVSFAGPITTGYATTGTRLVLALTHVVAAAIVIPAVARRLPHERLSE